ncbi:MAG: DUF4010 domain-containing protein [Betaproteobacteria bacterium]|nr:DUF4010 domain-containing protein [Betaproteobacteria bacterium]
MVVLISALNFSSYLLIKIVGAEHGVSIAGLLGGMVSSTAVTLGFSQRSRQVGEDNSSLALGILLAWTVMFFRVLIMTALINLELGLRLALPVGMLCVASLGSSWWLWRRRKQRERSEVKTGNNPFELDEAIKFGLLFGLVVVIARAAQVYLGDAGLYLAAAVAGLTDIDAITLAMANTITKDGMAIGFGSAELRRITLPIAALLLATGAAGALLV